ncbi:FadR/GntR family transcriptional regulator [Flavisphingomonas formosensis]|uniref:FadR/GntR family transcriptional regulator n=1 Tax=Flavisphingomonas formosensis TaxID=861534 RepID=UPI0018E04936|nr:GntR family transcriptional regulator [Sphingomonas formosensis]
MGRNRREDAPREGGRNTRPPIAADSDGGLSGRSFKTAELVAFDIVREIVDKQMAPGSRLPHEAEMLSHYRVSRASLREALRLLEVQGLIRLQPGIGVTVGHASPRNLGRTMTLFYQMNGASYEELLVAWTLTEPLLAELAARNPDTAKREAMLRPFLAATTQENGPQAINDGLAFHDAIAELAENRALAITYRGIGFIVSDHMLMSKDRTQLETFITEEHAEISAAVIAGDGKTAQALMAKHVEHVVEDFRAYWPAKLGERVRWR